MYSTSFNLYTALEAHYSLYQNYVETHLQKEEEKKMMANHFIHKKRT